VTIDGGCYEFGLMGGSFDINEKNGVWTGTVSHKLYRTGTDAFDVSVGFRTSDGYLFTVKKTVNVLAQHTGLRHINSKAATKDSDGNIEYWYCKDCDKYYADADATKEITKADTVTAKLPSDPDFPQTGDNSSLMLWMELLFINGGVGLFSTKNTKKKKCNC